MTSNNLVAPHVANRIIAKLANVTNAANSDIALPSKKLLVRPPATKTNNIIAAIIITPVPIT
ncbi:MAG: hypothetical protein IKG42_06840 [Clostridia bacterium]|nr:hypothetical protein [Clostridia bacterium]